VPLSAQSAGRCLETALVSSTQLSECIARATGVPEATVLLHMRNVREAGILTQGGRGRSAARMTTRDAANLLIAVAGASAVKDSVVPIHRQAQTWVREGTWEETLAVPELLALPADHRFADAVVALLNSAASGSLEALAIEIQGSPVDLIDDLRIPFWIKTTIAEPESTAFIEVIALDFNEDGELINEERRRVLYGGRKKLPGGNLEFDPPLDTELHGDLRHEHTFTHRTIQMIGNLLRGP